MPDTIEQLKIDTEDIRDRGQSCDRLVLRAIALGYGTRRELKDLLGFGYDAIEKALEREAGAIRSRSVGQIERFELVSENGNGAVKAVPFNRPMSEKKPPQNGGVPKASEPVFKIEDGGMKATGGRPRVETDFDYALIKSKIIAGETLKEIAKFYGMSYWTFYDRRFQDSKLKTAFEEGKSERRHSARRHPQEEVSPVGYIEEKKEPSTGAVSAGLPEPSAPVIKISAVNSKTGAQSMATPRAVLAADSRAPVLTKPEIRERIAKILNIPAVDSPVLTDALIEAEKEITAHILANQTHPLDSPEALLKIFNALPSALLKEIRDDDAWFMNAYETLIGILDDRMDGDQKAAVWTLLLYLKSIESERYAQENS